MKGTSFPIHPTLQAYQARLEQALNKHLPAAQTHPAHLHAAMHYAVLGGGKRIRPALVYASGSALGVSLAKLDDPACAIEFIHAYSLIHDDLPAMDDDDLRRGKPSCHKAYDEATAILAGDALQSLAFQTLAQHAQMLDKAQGLQIINILAVASGSRGMAGGQAIDLASVGQALDIAQLEDLHIHKTGALIRASVLLGAYSSAAATTAEIANLDHYAKCIGLAFQIHDDILDIEGNTTSLGKTSGKDRLQNKPTYPELLGMSEAKLKVQELYQTALTSLQSLDERANILREIAAYIVKRTH